MGAAENAVVASCREILTSLGVPHIRNNTGAFRIPGQGTQRPRFVAFGTKGWPDLIGVLPDGRFLAVECKAPDNPITKRKNTLSKEQREVRYQLLKQQALYITAKSGRELAQDLQGEGYFRDELKYLWT